MPRPMKTRLTKRADSYRSAVKANGGRTNRGVAAKPKAAAPKPPKTGARKGRANPAAVKSSQNKVARQKYSAQMKKMSPAKPRTAPKRSSGSGLQPTDANPIWALYRNIGDAIKRATGGK